MPAKRVLWFLMLVMALVLVACDDGGGDSSGANASSGDIPANAIQVSIIYAPESEQYMPEIIQRFNQSYREGTNPVTGAPLAEGERPIYVTGSPPQGGLSSGGVTDAIVAAALGSTGTNALRPTMFAPSVSHWLSLANLRSRRQLFDVADAAPTAISPVVIAIWQSRLDAIRTTLAAQQGITPEQVEIGWEELLGVLNSENGWADYGLEDGRRAVYYGHANPVNSSTALSTLVMEYYACARENGYTDRRMELSWVEDPQVQDCVRGIEQLVRHYSRRTEDFLEFIGQGPSYLDFVAMEETDIICLNTGGQQGEEVCNPPEEPLVAMYPKEGTFVHGHPIAIVNADWVTPEQREASRVFIDYVLMVPQQELIMSYGFRPANLDVELGYPFVEGNGVSPEFDFNIINIPADEVLIALQENWSLVRKQADIWLVIDTSGSMDQENKLDQAKQAALAFLDGMESNNRVGLALFNDDVEIRVPMANFETNEEMLRSHIAGLRANGGTELFMAVRDIVGELTGSAEGDRIRAVVLLSDGEDTGQFNMTLADATGAIRASQDSVNPVIVVPVAYGSGASINQLNAIALASNTQVVFGDPSNINEVLQIISSYF